MIFRGRNKYKRTNVIVKIVETEEKPQVVNNDEYCNIISNKDAIIEKVEATKGTAVVKKVTW